LADVLEENCRGTLADTSWHGCLTAVVGLARDQFATKPLLYAENDDIVVLSSEEIALRRVFPDPTLVPRELAAKEVRWWLN